MSMAPQASLGIRPAWPGVIAAYADRIIFLADGAVVDEMRDPTADSVIERIRTLGA